MKQISFLFLLSISILLVSCNPGKKADVAVDSSTDLVASTSVDVPFTLAERYFLKNNADTTKIKGNVIETVEVFEDLFGTATVMGPAGKRTEVDFKTQYIIPVIVASTNKETEIKPLKLTKTGADINLTYQVIEGEEQSYTTQPILLIVVDKSNYGTVSLTKE